VERGLGIGYAELVKQSLGLLESHRNEIDYEIRTTLYPSIVSLDVIDSLSKHIPRGARWVLQQFRATDTVLQKEAKSVKPYDDIMLAQMIELAKSNGVTSVAIRYP